jgi:tRNA (guanine37-N1)-methyltransferase
MPDIVKFAALSPEIISVETHRIGYSREVPPGRTGYSDEATVRIGVDPGYCHGGGDGFLQDQRCSCLWGIRPHIPALMSLRDRLTGRIPDDDRAVLSDRFDIIGDIAVLSLPPGLACHGRIIASAVMEQHHGVRAVLSKTSQITGDHRTARYDLLAGTSTITHYREYGFSYDLDLQTVFFTPRLASERNRVTGLVQEGEDLLVPFCGVGPFAIPAAAKGAHVLGVEKNPEACRWLTRNIRLNRVESGVTLSNGDAFDPGSYPARKFDRAIVPTPYSKDTILDLIIPKVQPGGMIHLYTFRKKHQIQPLIGEFRGKGLDPIFFRECGHVAPGVSRWVFDLLKT